MGDPAEKRADWLQSHIDRIMDERINNVLCGTALTPDRIRREVALARDDSILVARQMLLQGAKPTEILASIRGFEALSAWLDIRRPGDSKAPAQVAPVTREDAKRVADMIKKARGD